MADRQTDELNTEIDGQIEIQTETWMMSNGQIGEKDLQTDRQTNTLTTKKH